MRRKLRGWRRTGNGAPLRFLEIPRPEGHRLYESDFNDGWRLILAVTSELLVVGGLVFALTALLLTVIT